MTAAGKDDDQGQRTNDEACGSCRGGGEPDAEQMLPRQWRWGDEHPGSASSEEVSRPLFDERQAEIIAEAELLLACGMTFEEVAALLKRSRVIGYSPERGGEQQSGDREGQTAPPSEDAS